MAVQPSWNLSFFRQGSVPATHIFCLAVQNKQLVYISKVALEDDLQARSLVCFHCSDTRSGTFGGRCGVLKCHCASLWGLKASLVFFFEGDPLNLESDPFANLRDERSQSSSFDKWLCRSPEVGCAPSWSTLSSQLYRASGTISWMAPVPCVLDAMVTQCSWRT